MENLSRWQKNAFVVAAIALVAGISFVIALNGRDKPVLDKVPEDVVEKAQLEAPDIPGKDGPSRGGGTLVSPSEIVISNVNSGLQLPAITVTNKSLEAKNIATDFIPVSRFLLEGVPVVELTKENIDLGKEYVSLNKSSFTLKPGQSTEVVARLLKKPENGVLSGSIGITVLDKKPSFSNPEKNDVKVAVENNLRVNAMLYASWPGAAGPGLTVEYLRGKQVEKEIQFGLNVKGGKGLTVPSGNVEIENSLGRKVASRKIAPGQVVIPNNQRQLRTEKNISGLAPGVYEANARVLVGKQVQRVSWRFEIDRDGNLPTPATDLALEANPSWVKGGEPVEIFVQVKNTGTKNFQPSGFIRLYPLGKNRVIKEAPIKLAALEPGSITELTEKFTAPTKPGNYEALVQLETEDRSLLDQRVVSILVKKEPPAEPGAFIKFRDWLSDNPLAAVGTGMALVGLMLALFTGISVLIDRRKQK
jgi:hypothetical protein